MRVSTLETIAGRQVDETLGVVRGTIVWSRGLKKFSRGGIRAVEYMTTADVAEGLNKAREDAEKALVLQAEAMGADAIVGMRFEIVEMGAGLFSASAMGTAVKTSATAPAAAPVPVLPVIQPALLPAMAAANDAGAVILPFRRMAG
ncbi:heavy metal-binding domain-containing protein [Aestuariivirga sp.]|uniref:heavy metal-binding domain-containing protein n=1 Tax=Aestuariivirga sp. TaxID=2650926 RepID=UPI0039E3769C